MTNIYKKIDIKYVTLAVAVCISVLSLMLTSGSAFAQSTPYYGPIYLSQSFININAGQTVTVNVSGGSGNYFISSNSNSTVVSAGASSGLVQVQGLSQGTSNLTICSQASTAQCATLQVNVTGGTWNNQNISLSQTSLTLNIGQTQSVTISGIGSGYYISNNNSSIASAYISGSQIVVTGNQSGTVSFSVCSSTNNTSCTSLYVQVGTGTNNNWNNNWNNTWNNGWNNSSWNNSWQNQTWNWQYQNPNQYYYPYDYNYQQTYTQPVYTQPTTYTYVQPTYQYTSGVSGQPVSGVFLNQVPATGVTPGVKSILVLTGLMLSSLLGALVFYKYYALGNQKLLSFSNVSNVPTVSSKSNSQGSVYDKATAFKLMQQQKGKKKMQG
jgi:hypothetical protein